MKLLPDQNLSPRLCDRLRDVWTEGAYATRHGFTIVSEDGDFSGRSSLFGAPPKVIWLALGNCSTSEIERRLRRHRQEIETFVTEPDTTLLVIARPTVVARRRGTPIRSPA